MKILICGAQDSGNQGFLLARAMRDILKWDAKSLINMDSYLRYEHDWMPGANCDEEEVMKWAKDVDFFIMMDQHINPGSSLKQYINVRNSCVWGLGTPLRSHLDRQLINQLRLHSLIVPPAPDPTITPYLMASAFFESLIINTKDIDTLVKGIEKNEELTVMTCVTQKKEKFIREMMAPIIDMGIRFEVVTNTPWKETIKKKATAHIILDPPSEDTCPSMNTWEALYLGSLAVGPYSSWGYSIHPSMEPAVFSYNPDMGIYAKTFEEAMTMAVKNATSASKDKKWAPRWKRWVTERYGDDNVVRRWAYWIQWALNRRV